MEHKKDILEVLNDNLKKVELDMQDTVYGSMSFMELQKEFYEICEKINKIESERQELFYIDMNKIQKNGKLI